LNDCEYCWTHPCKCGWDFRNAKISYLEKQIKMFKKIIEFKNTNPKAKFSYLCDKETKDDKRFMKFMR